MNWQQAKTNTLELWRRIRAAIGTAEPLDLLIEINAICDLCELATAEAAGEPDRCRYCPAYQQFGGCKEVSAHMSELVVEKDWEQLVKMTDDFIDHVEQMDVPPTLEVPAELKISAA